MNAEAFEKAMHQSRGLRVADGSCYQSVAQHAPKDERRCVTALNALIEGIAVRAIIYELGPTRFQYEVRLDGYPVPGSPFGDFETVEHALQAAKGDVGCWILQVLERV